MRKRLITLLVAIVMVCTLFTGCGASEKTKATNSTKTEVGSYSLFQTTDVQEYLSFLESFDETKYEIVDISTSIDGNFGKGSSEFYMVTYKKIAE